MEIGKVVKMFELLKEFETPAKNSNPAAVTEAKKNPVANDPLVGQLVLVRTYASGVHFGELLRNDGRLIELRDARRIWHWEKAFTLNQVARDGIGKNSKVSLAVDFIRILDGLEIMPITEEVFRKMAALEKDMSK